MITPGSLIGRHIDQFRLDEFIAKGAMGLIYKAFDTVLFRTVVLKLISKRDEEDQGEEERAMREEARKRLIQEAKAAGRLNHPNILTIFSYGETEDFEYICMEYVTGKTLAQILQERKTIEPTEAIDIGEQILMALDAADREHIIHRDIKPSNIMVTDDGRLKVMDFGIAKLPSFSMTTTGTVLGTPYYMSPEQVSGQKVDIRSDIFSTGAVLYQAVTGERPFEATNTATLAYKIVQVDPVPPDVLNVTIPHPFGAIIKKALLKNPGERYQSPSEMLKALRALKLEEIARGYCSTDATVKVWAPDRDAAIQADKPPTLPEKPAEPEGLPSKQDKPVSIGPRIQLVPPQSDADREARAPKQQAHPKTSSPPESSQSQSDHQDAERAASGEAALKTQTPTEGEGQAASKSRAPGSTKPGKPPRAASSTGGKIALAVVLGVVLLGGGYLIRDFIGEEQEPSRSVPAESQQTAANQPSPPPPNAAGSTTAEPTVESLLLQAKSRELENDPAQSLKLLEKAVAIDPSHFEANFQLARILTHRQEYERAIEVYKGASRLNDKAPEIYFNLGYIYLNQGAYDAAIENYEACLALHPAYKDEVLTNLGIAYLKKNQGARAQELFQQALEINPSNFVARSYARNTSGPAAKSSPSPATPPPAEGVGSTGKTPVQSASGAAPLVDEAKRLMQVNAVSAEKLLREALSLDPNSFEAYLQLGRLFTFKKNYDQAIAHYEKALSLNDQAPDAFFNLGFIYMTKKDYDRAIQSYEACLKLKPPYMDEVLTNLGLCYLRKNAPHRARTLFLEALDWNPQNEIARNYLKQLDRSELGGPSSPAAVGEQSNAFQSDGPCGEGARSIDGALTRA